MSEVELTSIEARLIGATVEALRTDISEMKTAIREMMTALSRLAETSSALERAFLRIEDLEKRLRPIEIVMPGLNETRKWIITMGLTMLSLMLVALATLVLRPPATVYQVPVPTPPAVKAPVAMTTALAPRGIKSVY